MKTDVGSVFRKSVEKIKV